MFRICRMLLFLYAISFSQTPNKQLIISAGAYYYSSGIAADVNEARDRALQNLTQQIAVQVVSSFERIIREQDEQ